MEKNMLVIGHTFPEPLTTAAGQRMSQLLQVFKDEHYAITFATTAAPSPYSMELDDQGFSVETIHLNDSGFDGMLRHLNPTVVMFDRFVTEEQFGWRVAETCPNAMRILDTEDLHFLRKAREEAHRKGYEVTKANLYTDAAKRELASILRCDLTLIISQVEYGLLQSVFRVPDDILHYLPLMVDISAQTEKNRLPTYVERRDFVTIGNLRHAPNVDSVLYLKHDIWPLVRKALPSAKLKVYGAYAPQRISALHSPKEGFFIEGWTPNALTVLENARVCLAPLRFGAGQKGKLLDAMRAGTPFVTTSIGAEAMVKDGSSCDYVQDTPEGLAEAAVNLYQHQSPWETAQDAGFERIGSIFDRKLHVAQFNKRIEAMMWTLAEHRQNHFLGQVLHHQTLQSSKYMSKWIEAKKGENR
ncbi:MAG: glycosyltransferase [Flavobacteriaceae bacterium]|nr:glycosyltransferase [Flavobacteriaceae bacterium]